MRRVIIMIAFCATVFSATAKNNDDSIIVNLRQEVNKMPHGKERLDKILELANLSQLRPEGANDAMLMLDEAKRLKIDSLQAMALAISSTTLVGIERSQLQVGSIIKRTRPPPRFTSLTFITFFC